MHLRHFRSWLGTIIIISRVYVDILSSSTREVILFIVAVDQTMMIVIAELLPRVQPTKMLSSILRLLLLICLTSSSLHLPSDNHFIAAANGALRLVQVQLMSLRSSWADIIFAALRRDDQMILFVNHSHRVLRHLCLVFHTCWQAMVALAPSIIFGGDGEAGGWRVVLDHCDFPRPPQQALARLDVLHARHQMISSHWKTCLTSTRGRRWYHLLLGHYYLAWALLVAILTGYLAITWWMLRLVNVEAIVGVAFEKVWRLHFLHHFFWHRRTWQLLLILGCTRGSLWVSVWRLLWNHANECLQLWDIGETYLLLLLCCCFLWNILSLARFNSLFLKGWDLEIRFLFINVELGWFRLPTMLIGLA